MKNPSKLKIELEVLIDTDNQMLGITKIRMSTNTEIHKQPKQQKLEFMVLVLRNLTKQYEEEANKNKRIT